MFPKSHAKAAPNFVYRSSNSLVTTYINACHMDHDCFTHVLHKVETTLNKIDCSTYYKAGTAQNKMVRNVTTFNQGSKTHVDAC